MRDGADQPVNSRKPFNVENFILAYFYLFANLFFTEESVEQDRSESTPLYVTTVDTSTLRLIVSFFFGFSITVTIVLGIQLYYGNSTVKFSNVPIALLFLHPTVHQGDYSYFRSRHTVVWLAIALYVRTRQLVF